MATTGSRRMGRDDGDTLYREQSVMAIERNSVGAVLRYNNHVDYDL